MVIFNLVALISVVPAAALGLCAQRILGGGPRAETIATCFGCVVCVAIDVGYRWHHGRSQNRYEDLGWPRSGGHVFFIPTWVWAILMLIGTVAGW